MNTYTIGDAVITGEWIHYTDKDTKNLVWERHIPTWKGRIYRLCLFFKITRIRNWK